MIKHECKYKHPDCLCNRCKNDTPDVECCLWDDYERKEDGGSQDGAR